MSTFRTKHNGLDGFSLVSFCGADVTRGGLNLRVAHQGGDREGIKAGLSQSSSEGSAEIVPDQAFEWDGYRAICFLENGSVRFASKNRKSLTQRFPDLQRIPKSIKADTAILDGEIVALDKQGLPCFAGLRSGRLANECVIVFYAFDLIYLNGHDITQKSVLERKAILKRILPKQATGRVRYTEHIAGDGERLFRELENCKLEGMVAKRADSLYVGGRTRAWLKIKTKAGKEEMRVRSETWGHPTA